MGTWCVVCSRFGIARWLSPRLLVAAAAMCTASAFGAFAQGVINQNTTGGIKDTQVGGSGGVNTVPATAAGTGGTTNLNTSLGGFGTNLRSDDLLRPLQPRSHVRY